VLDRVLAGLAVTDLPIGVDAAEKELAVLLDHPADSRALNDVGAYAQDFHADAIRRYDPADRQTKTPV
jgi:hypothetical protein